MQQGPQPFWQRTYETQLADHEEYHTKAAYAAAQTTHGINPVIRKHIIETFSEEEFREILNKYVELYPGVYNSTEIRSGYELDRLMEKLEEEVLADAYAGMNMFDAGATQFTDTVREFMEENNISRRPAAENGVRETTGPPTDG